MKTDEIRKKFLAFFKSKGHEIVPSDSLVPADDPTLLFTGAGMNQFKEKFLGRNITYKTAASSQKCLRTADLENVGKTSGHHTFFEMLGNFSFGDYFKKEAIIWAWEFLVVSCQLPVARLWVSVYKDDDEAYKIWNDIVKVPKDKIIKFGEKENFWPSEAPTKGPNGPCGPCSEIFYDYGPSAGCGKPGCTPACGCGRFSEVWNLVFTQFDRQPDGSLKPLPSRNIDTGMGLERIAAVMQGVRTNFEIDIFKPIIATIKSEIRNPKSEMRIAQVNAIADHVRAAVFAIADGVMPSNEERGYVVRKLIRRAASYAGELGIKEPFLYKLVNTVTDVMKVQYPELISRRDDIAMVVKHEEESYANVFKVQLPIVNETYKKIASEKQGYEAVVSGTNSAFIFSDTYGVPFEVSAASAATYGISLDKKLFEQSQEEQRKKSRASTKIKGEIFSETFAKKVEALGLRTEFLGYEKSHSEAKVLAVLEGGEVILDATPFYGESGGQIGDWGMIQTASGKMEVEDAKRIGDTIVHIGRMLSGKISKGEIAKVTIDDRARRKIMANHTATHLLQSALRKVLGEHVRQTGSLVDQEHLRFDFTHMKKMDSREIARVEEIVSDNIKKAIPVKKEIKDIATAKREGAIALFGEKYADMVRVVTIGDVSKELCGGTHVDNTKDIGIFRIKSESSIASGTRRIVAVTGDAAREWMREEEEARNSRLKAEKEKGEEKKIRDDRLKEIASAMDGLIAKGRPLGRARLIAETLEGADMDILRVAADMIRKKEKGAVIVLSAKEPGKASFVISVPADLAKDKTLDAGGLAKELAKALGGSGGGRSDFAQGGGKDPARLDIALEEIIPIIERMIRGA